ncbi:MAG: antitoxin [Candidatus Aminicenantes bacterium]|nr:antitoxin [Candidatus Aminicenantes bacterium]NIM80341.1 antitoxin [Candidatus Aminicenantes bacterium]NIN16832.1 antitoxin [Candidatus Aminicenantes bacterium]NIN40688.1 antitoxin [Candidatus Aminicenantes bacterium]NIN83511.1 antitoxin [Candidatus Aminicenantes bacterium]
MKEKDLMDSIENEEWVEIENFEEEKLKYEAYAAATLKDEQINIRIPGRDLEELKRKAIEEGLTYQALISSILHKFISGKLVEAK